MMQYFTNGYTIGKWILRLKVISLSTTKNKKSFFNNILKKELCFSINWIIFLFIFLIFIQPSLASKLIENKNLLKNKINEIETFNSLEKFLVGTVLSIANLNIIIEMILMLTCFSKTKISIIDLYSETRTVYLNKNQEVKKVDINLAPENLNWEIIIWQQEEEDNYEKWNQ
ncbi:RDD family protein [Mesomycoplasma lagogenitalium]|uniref:Uncharacterized protein n=1 Tax=Mesomycoplasma lagogenitalium TaxID=171286 RepID=A0ABY8LUP2_9BACT|nr:RDD family protein [Mesomycoplasma lagogenitalium]WGI36962.1 hypothetical protein QEG99_01610 [Mesomycoplasma lagogenitalium]